MIELGIDIIEIERIRANIRQYGDKFLSKILTPFEKIYCLKYADPAPCVAGRFAAKEAVAKALRCGFGEELEFHDIEIIHGEKGGPLVKLSLKANAHFGVPNFKISISHCKSHAIAIVVLINFSKV